MGLWEKKFIEVIYIELKEASINKNNYRLEARMKEKKKVKKKTTLFPFADAWSAEFLHFVFSIQIKSSLKKMCFLKYMYIFFIESLNLFSHKNDGVLKMSPLIYRGTRFVVEQNTYQPPRGSMSTYILR